MDLFEIVNKHVFPSVHALMLEPFKSMWEKDTTPDKENCIKDFTYIEFVCSPKKSNPFFGRSEEERVALVKREVYKNEEHPITHDVLTACMRYNELLEHSSPSYPILRDSLTTAEKLRKFLRNLDPADKTVGGGLLLKPKDISAALKDIPSTVLSLEETWKKVSTELSEDSKTRNNREIGDYER